MPVLLLALSTVLPAFSAQGPTAEASRFQRTVQVLIASGTEAQSDFARLALVELAQVYMAEADLARQEAREEGANTPKLLGWSLAVDQYANRLLVLYEEIAAGLPVQLSMDSEQLVTVTVQGQRLMLTHPRRRQQAAYEQRLLAEFCAREDCAGLASADRQLTPIPVTAATVSPVWSFSGRGPTCFHQGITVQFTSSVDLPWSKSICGQLMQEARNLATEIAWQRLQGVAVDWNSLAILPTAQRPEHLVQLNSAGDSVLVTIPLIHGSAGLLRDITPWLRGVSSRGGGTAIELQAARYRWEGGLD